jgi:hypothetical protein
MKDGKDNDKLHECPVMISETCGGPLEPAFAVSGEGDPHIRTGHYPPGEIQKWTGSDGIKRIRHVRTSGASVGASAAYSAGYEQLDWGN